MRRVETRLRFGVYLPAYVFPGEAAPTVGFLQDFARRAEDLGFDSLWVVDHLFASPPSYRVVFMEPVTTLALVVSATKRVTLGTGILVLPLRDPVVTAKAFANLDAASEGRVVLGVGVGWDEREFHACQVAKKTRGRRMDESWRSSRGSGLRRRSRTRESTSPSRRCGLNRSLSRDRIRRSGWRAAASPLGAVSTLRRARATRPSGRSGERPNSRTAS